MGCAVVVGDVVVDGVVSESGTGQGGGVGWWGHWTMESISSRLATQLEPISIRTTDLVAKFRTVVGKRFSFQEPQSHIDKSSTDRIDNEKQFQD